jgi:plastocyanin
MISKEGSMRTGPAVLTLMLLLVACGEEEGGGGNSTGVRDVTVGGTTFSPTTVAPDASGDVVWTWNSGGAAHDIIFEDAITGSGEMTSGTFTVKFLVDGTFRYRCAIHSTAFGSGMSGRVIRGGDSDPEDPKDPYPY